MFFGTLAGAMVLETPDVPLQAKSPQRAAASVLVALPVVVVLWNQSIGAAIPKFNSEAFRSLTLMGHLPCFGVQALCFQSVHMLLSAIAEISLLGGAPLHGLFNLAYAFSTFVACNAVVSALLLTVLKAASGVERDSARVLGGRALVVALAMIDFFAVKERDLARIFTPRFSTLVKAQFIYFSVYALMLHANTYITGGTPHPAYTRLKGFSSKVAAVAIYGLLGAVVVFLLLFVRGGLYEDLQQGDAPLRAEDAFSA